MFIKEINILNKIAEDFSHIPRIIRSIVYGSRVRGDYRGDSDIDILVIVDIKDNKLKGEILDLIYSYELQYDISLSLSILSLDEYIFNERMGSPFIKSLEKEGKTFYDSEQKRKKRALKISY